jgi:hypothetical protein
MVKLYCLSFAGEVFPYFCKDMWETAVLDAINAGVPYKTWEVEATEEQEEALFVDNWLPAIPEE